MISEWILLNRSSDHARVNLYTKGNAVYWWAYSHVPADSPSFATYSPTNMIGQVMRRNGDLLNHIIYKCTDGYVRIAPRPRDVEQSIMDNLEIFTDNEFDSLGEVYRMLSL